LTISRTDDLDGDGTTDLSTYSATSVAANGVKTETVEHRSQNNSLLDRTTVVTSSDRRTVTQSYDADGNGINDRVSMTTIAANGQMTTTTDLLSSGGVLEARRVLTTSGDGLDQVETVDRNGDGRIDYRTVSGTTLGADGSVFAETDIFNYGNVRLAGTEHWVSDDGLEQSTRLDSDGDGVFESRIEEQTTLLSDGGFQTVQSAFDGSSNLLATITTDRSGDGLITTTQANFSEYVVSTTNTTTIENGISLDWIEVVTKTADGGVTENTQFFGSNSGLVREVSFGQSADGRTRTMEADLDGDGILDRDMVSVVDLGRNTTTVYRDFARTGEVEQIVTTVTTANGLSSVDTFDLDGDGQADIVRARAVTLTADGSEILTKTEAAGSGALGYRSVTTTAANGLRSETQFDIDGDGTFDGSSARETIIKADGSKETSASTHYANGELRSEFITNISADGRTTSERMDYDGNGIADKTVVTTVLADGSTVSVETAFDKGGMRGQVFTTVTAADGLSVSITRSGNEQTITRSALDNGTYTWDNGVKAALGATNVVVSHNIDALGIETWVITKNWYETYTWTSGENSYTSTRAASSTATVRLDEGAKARIFEEAARIYDTVLDRDLDFTEREQLIAHIVDGELDQEALTSSLIGSSEFATRYGTLSNAEFVTQIYLNAVGRAPTLNELDQALKALSATAGTPLAKTRAEIALELSETVEHLVVGNAHLATNNFDVIINPAQFERSLDVAYTRSLAEKLVDTVFDRDATEQELDYLSERLLKDVSNPDDLVALLIAQEGDIQVVALNSLKGLSGAALVEQAFLNAFGRQPTAQEQFSWTDALSAGRITANQFVASLAMSVEKMEIGNSHVATTAPTTSLHVGTAAAELIAAGSNPLLLGTDSDVLQGLGGSDTLMGGGGNDRYIWSLGDGNDLIDDIGTSQLNTDTLTLTNVMSTDVKLSRVPDTNDLRIRIVSTGEIIVINNQMLSLTSAYGIERIVFGDGIAWSLDEIKGNTMFFGSGDPFSIGLGNYVEHIYGGGGNDTLNGSAGNDTLVGGADQDLLKGGAGEDVYIWNRGDGADTIQDTSDSTLEVDRLILSDVASGDVALLDVATSRDIIVRISGVGGADILIKDRDYEVSGVVKGRGIEVIEFSDGEVWTLEDIFFRGSQTGDSGNQNFAGTAYQDHYIGLGGQDTLSGLGGDDTIDGGAGNDSLVGGNGADTYVWRKGDGNDTIRDADTTTNESDVLVLDVNSDKVALTRVNGSLHLTITIAAAGVIPVEVLTVIDRFNTGYNSNSGIEEIRFADGVIWNLTDIRTRTRVEGTGNAEILTGTSFRDNLYGFGGADTINAGLQDDYLVGGHGADVLDGAAGNDMFEWSSGDGNDILSDTSTSMTEVDTLVLTNVAPSAAVLSKVGADLLVTAGTETITVKNRFNTGGDGRGIEFLVYGDGVTMEVLAGPVAIITTEGTSVGQTLTGWAFSDLQYGRDGVDILDAKGGEDTLYGGEGNDTLKGGDGSDTYVWTRGEDNDVIDDDGNSRTELDTLVLTDVSSIDVTLIRKVGTTAAADRFDLRLIISGTGEELLLIDQFRNSVEGDGIERIEFADGIIWTLDEIRSRARFEGTSGNDVLDTTDTNTYGDLMYGFAGNDTVYTGLGDDTLIGGAGADILRGGGNSDTYIWAIGDGNDTIDDSSGSTNSVDTLFLSNVLPGQVQLKHASGSNNLVITIGSEIITILNRFSNIAYTYGIERIVFADGTQWNLVEVLSHTKMNGTTGNDVLTGNGYADQMFGLGGNDTLNAGDGDDVLTGGAGNDSLAGSNGADSYIWTEGDGNDTLNDAGTSYSSIDRLVLTNVSSSDVTSGAVTLTRVSGSSNVILTITGGATEVITLTNQMYSTAHAYGVETIVFSDGVIWTMEDILDQVKVLGTATGTSLSGTNFRDNIFGLGGNDTLTGSNGDDRLVGGTGADSLNGGSGVDIASYHDASQRVRVDLGVATGQTGMAGGEEVGDILVGIEALEGSTYADTLIGNAESNDLYGLGGNDSLTGKDGYDRLFGGSGADTLDGGIGADFLSGGAGADRFIFVDTAFGNDEISDFEDGLDKLSFALAIADDIGDFTIVGNGSTDVLISIGAQSISLHGMAPITIGADDFLFV